MHIVHAPDIELDFWKALGQVAKDEGREAVEGLYHVSDLLTPRKGYFRFKYPGRAETKDNLGYFLAGNAHHLVAEQALAGSKGQREREVKLVVNGAVTIVGTQDVYDEFPIEFKTSRKWSIPENPEEHYTSQLWSYAALENKLKARLVVFYINPGRTWNGKTGTKPDLKIWEYEFTQEELDKRKQWLEQQAKELHNAIKTDDISRLPLCMDWMCGKKWKGKVNINCPFYDRCRPEGRYPEEKIK